MTNLISGLKTSALLGAGAFGQVYLGQDEVHGPVAVKKLIRKAGWDDAEWSVYKNAFLSEAQNLSRAAHDHVVQVYHAVAADDGQSVHICMAFCPGGSLQTPYEQGPLTLARVRKIGTDVLMGLSALHARKMIHRDIKPANILLDSRGNALIGDFGLVTDDIVFGYADQAGYYDHLAYEVWHGGGTSVKTDIWAVGATLYRLLHGEAWYKEAQSPKDLISQGGFADGLKWLPHVPRRWRRVIRQFMEDDTGKRYQTADQALGALSSLPVAPAWNATVAPEQVQWEMASGTRLNRVEWKRVPRQHEWKAWSEPAAGRSGRKRAFGGSGGVVSGKDAVSGLENLFEV